MRKVIWMRVKRRMRGKRIKGSMRRVRNVRKGER
jgi:hypothetical protein